jgi:hypothetical protein
MAYVSALVFLDGSTVATNYRNSAGFVLALPLFKKRARPAKP